MTLHHPDDFGKPATPKTQSRLRDFLRDSDRTDDGRWRTAPHSVEAEQALLGAILLSNATLDRVSGFLQGAHFFEALHGEIFDVAAHMISGGRSVTPVTLAPFFENALPIDTDLTVPQYLGRLVVSATTTISAKAYGQMIYELALRRNLIVIGQDLVNAAYDSPHDFPPEAQVAEAESRLYEVVARKQHEGGFVGFGSSVDASLAMAMAAKARGGGLSGLRTGLVDLDLMTGGLQNSDLIVLAGRPSMGKTALATNIAYNVAKNYRTEPDKHGELQVVDGAIVGFFSLEMSDEQLTTRILAEQAEISSADIRRGKLSDEQMMKLQETADIIRRVPLHIDHQGGLTIAQLASRARKLKRQKGLGLLIVDYLQLLAGEGGRGSNRVQEITAITTGLKALAKELGVPIIALSQLSRTVEQREDKRPQLSDLRESGSIEQDADVVMFVFREEYYVERAKPSETNMQAMSDWEDQLAQVAGKAEVILGKQRHGPCGTVPLAYEAHLTRFSSLAKDHQQAAQAPRPARNHPGRADGWKPPSHIIEGPKPPMSLSERAIAAANARGRS